MLPIKMVVCVPIVVITYIFLQVLFKMYNCVVRKFSIDHVLIIKRYVFNKKKNVIHARNETS